MSRRILLFGLSANPPTGAGGHCGLVRHFCEEGMFDELWIVPVYRHMFRSKREQLVDFETRYEMCCAAFEELSSPECLVQVVRAEKEVFDAAVAAHGGPAEDVSVGTYDLVRYLSGQHPDAHFSFLMGTDTYADLRSGKWRRSEDLLDLLSIAVVRRLGEPEAPELRPQDSLHEVASSTDVSSTAVRQSTSMTELGELVHPKVLQIMLREGLYAIGDVMNGGESADAANRRRKKGLKLMASATLATAATVTLTSVMLTKMRRS